MNKMIRSCWSWLVAATLALVCMDARAEAKDIVIHADGSVTYGGESAATYSSENYYAITKAGDFGDSVSSIKTEGEVANAGTSITYTGVRGIDAASAPLSLTSMPGGIDIANNGWIGAINQQASGATETSDVRLEGMGDIKVKSSGSYGAKGFGFNSAKNPDITQSKFYAAANSLTVEAEGTAYAIHGALAGRTARIDIAGAVTVKGVGASGKAYGSNLTAATPMGQSEWNFGSLTVSSESQLAYGLHCAGGVTAQVALNGDMIVTGATYAIGFRLAGTADFTLKGKDAKPIDVKVMSGSKYAMAADIGGSSSTAKLDLTADNFIVMSSTEAYGPYVENAGAGFFGDVRNLSVNGGTGTACALYVNGGTALLVGCTNLVAQGATGSTAIQAENGATVSLGEAELPTALAGDVTLEAGATLNLSNAVDLAGNVSNAGTVSIGYKAGRPAIALTGAFANTGTLAVDMTGADADVEYTLIDNLDGSENAYGTISITPGWNTKVVDGDLVAYVKRTCQIGDKKYSTLQEALADVKAGETVELLCDIEDAGAVTVASETTLKANGKKLAATDVTLASSFKVEATGLEENTGYWVMFYDASGSWCGNDLYTTAAGQTSISVTKNGTNAAKARVYKNDGQWNPEPNVVYSLVGGTLALDPAGTVEFSGKMANTGTILVDMTGADGAAYKLADYTGAAYVSYGAKGVGYKFAEGADNGYALQTLDGDLYAYRGAAASKETLAVKSEWVGTAFGETVTLGAADYVYGVNAFGNFEDMTAGISDETTGVVINGEEFGLNGNSGIRTISNTSGATMTISTVGAAKSSAPELCNGTYLTIGTRADLPQDYVLAEGSDLTVFQFYTEANENITFRIDGALKAEGSILLKDYSNVTVGKTGTLTLDGSSRPSASGTNFHDWGILTVYGVLNLGLRDLGGQRLKIGDDGYNNDDMELNVVGGTVNVYSVENATGVEKYSTKDPAVTVVGGYDPEYDSTPATLSVSEGGAYITEGKIVNHGLVAIAAGANESGRTSQIVASSFDGEHGTVLVDMTGATEKSYKLIDVSAASSYGTYAFAEGKDCGYMLSVVDNDLVAVKAVAKIGDVGFETLWSAILAAKDMPGTAENPTAVQLMPGVVQEGNIYKNTFDLSNVVIQGAADGTSTIKDCCISFQGGYDKVWKNVTFKDIVWDASYIVFSVFKSEDLVFDGNTFTNQTRSGSLGGVHFTTECKNLTYVNNRFEGGTDGSIAAINSNGSGLTGNITITNNIFRNSHWRSLQLMFKSNDGVNDTLTIRDNWFSGNASSVQIVGSGDASADTVVANIQYNVFDDVPTTYSLIMYNTNPEKTTYNNDHNYYVRNPDAAPGYFYANWGACKAYNVFNFGVYPYYSAYHKDELAAGTMTVRESLYDLVQPGAVIVKANGNAPVYPDLAAALEAAVAGDRVKMLVDSDADVVLKAGVTLDTNARAHGAVTAEDGSFLKDNGDGSYTALTVVATVGEEKFATIAEAIAAVPENGTVKIVNAGAAEPDLNVAADKAFALDLNGKSLATALTVEAGSMTLTNGAVSTTVTVAGGTLAVVAGVKVVAPVAVSVAGGALDVSGGQLQGLTSSAVLLGKGVSATVAGGTFIAPAGVAPIAADEASAATGDYPANFIWPELDEAGKETGYPLFSSRIPAAFVATGYVVKDNKDGTWTVTAGAPEIKTDTTNVTVTSKTEGTPAPVTPEEAQQKANEVKDDIVKAMKDPEVADLIGTGLKENVFAQDDQGNTVLKDDVVTQLQKQAVQDKVNKIIEEKKADGMTEDQARQYAESQKPDIEEKVNEAITKNSASTTESHVEVKLEAVEVAVSKETTETTVLEATLTKVTFDVKPIVTLVTTIDSVVTKTTIELKDGEMLDHPVLVRLWLNAEFLGTVAKVTHKHVGSDDEVEIASVQTGVNEKGETRKFVEVTWQRFSEAIVEAEDATGKACLANGKLYDKVADALADTLPEDATIKLLADCGETGLALGPGRTIQLNEHLFSGSLATAAGNEMVKTTSGEIYEAPIAVDVPTSATTHMSVRGFAFPAEVTTDEAKRAFLAEEVNGRPRWQGYALGTDAKLLPVIDGAAEGFSKVVIRAQDGFAVNTPARCGVSVKFNLVWKAAGSGAFMQYGETSAEPHFQVDVKDIGPNTRWKIQTMFETTEAE